MDISPQMKNQLNQLEQIRQQLQVIAAQRSQLEAQRKETELALEGLEKVPEDAGIYRTAGTLLVQVEDRKALKDELEEDRESLGVRITSLENQESKLKGRFRGLQESLQQSLDKE